MTRLKDGTFEGASLTGTNGFTSTTGSPTLDSTSKIKGTYSARTNWASATNMNGTVSGLSVSEVWFSFYIYAAALPSSGSPRIVTMSNGNTQMNLTLSSAGVLNMRNNSTTIGTVATISANTLYRVGLHAKVSSGVGNADCVYDAYITASGSPDAAFGTAAVSSSTNTMNVSNANFTSIVFGMNNGIAATADIYWDNIRIDDVAMPTDDVGGTNTAKTITVSVTSTLVNVKGVGKPISQTVSNTITFIRGVNKPITLSITETITATKNASLLKTITATVNETISLVKGIGKPISVACTTTISRIRNIANTISIASTGVLSVSKNINKPISVISTTSLAVIKNIGKNIFLLSTSTIAANKDIAKTISRSITETITAIQGKGYYKTINVVVVSSSLITKNILKPITVIVSTVNAMGKEIGKTITANVNAAINAIAGRLIFKDISVVVNTVVNKTANIGITFSVIQDTAVNVARSLTLLITATINAPVILAVQKDIQITIHTVVNNIITFSKLLANQFTNEYLKKNSRTIALSLQNKVISLLGKNTRILDLQDTNHDS